MFFNMKIEVNEDQSLDEVVRELERLGYIEDRKENPYLSTRFVHTYKCGTYDHKYDDLYFGEITTLTQLKEM